LKGPPIAPSFGIIIWDLIFPFTTTICFDVEVMPPLLAFWISPLLYEEPGQLKVAWVLSDVVQPEKGKFNLWVAGIASFLVRPGTEEAIKQAYVFDNRGQQ
jgi:hypothetical protein